MKKDWIERGRNYRKPAPHFSVSPDPELTKPTEPVLSQVKFRAWLDGEGRLRTRGLPPDGCSLFDVLICLGATVEEIERHIGPIHHAEAWEKWTGVRLAFTPEDHEAAI